MEGKPQHPTKNLPPPLHSCPPVTGQELLYPHGGGVWLRSIALFFPLFNATLGLQKIVTITRPPPPLKHNPVFQLSHRLGYKEQPVCCSRLKEQGTTPCKSSLMLEVLQITSLPD